MTDHTDPCRNYHGGNELSIQAHGSIVGRKDHDKQVILEFVRARGWYGATCWEIEQKTGLSHQTASARCTELKRDGELKASGTKRPTGSGRKAAVLVAS